MPDTKHSSRLNISKESSICHLKCKNKYIRENPILFGKITLTLCHRTNWAEKQVITS